MNRQSKVLPRDIPFIFELKFLRKLKLWNIGSTSLTPEWTAWFGEIIEKHPSLGEIEVYTSIVGYLGMDNVRQVTVKRNKDRGDGGQTAIYESLGSHWNHCLNEWKRWK